MSVFRKVEGGRLGFRCPGCGDMHQFETSRWTVTGPEDAPTVVPSLLITCGHYVTGYTAEESGCWCKWNREHPTEKGPECYRCHSFITNGQIQFLTDCTHKLAGKTVPLEPV